MPRQLGEPVSRIHVMLFDSDLATLGRLYGTTVGVGPAVRAIVRKFLRSVQLRKEKAADPVSVEDVFSDVEPDAEPNSEPHP